MTPPLENRVLPLAVPAAYPVVVALVYLGLLFLGTGAGILSAVRMFVVTAVGLSLIGGAVNLLMRDRHRGGLMTLVIVLLLITGTDARYVGVIALVVVLLIAERIVSARQGSAVPWPRISSVLSRAAVVGIIMVVITGVQKGGFARVIADLTPIEPVVAQAVTTAGRPDIYILMLDGYARPDKLRELFGFDDDPFLAALEARGFDISGRSRSNYILTNLAIPSLLNMRHIDDLIGEAPVPDDRATYRTAARRLVSDSEVARQLRRLDYEIGAISAGFEEVILRGADRVIDTGQVNELELVILRESALAPLLGLISPDFFGDQQRDRTLDVLAAARTEAARPLDRPRFLFVHVPSPHSPIVFGPNGEPIPANNLDNFYDDTAVGIGLTREAFGRRYVGQVQFINGRVLEVVDAILASTSKPPVILVMSDHGSASGLDWGDLPNSDFDERTANLFAALTPGHLGVFPEDVTLVNTFPLLLEAYFGLAVPRQPDTIYSWYYENDYLTVLPELSRTVDN